MISLAPAALAAKNARSRASISSDAARGGSTYTSSAPSVGDQVAEALDVLVESALVARLEHDDEVRERRVLDRLRRCPSSSPRAAVIAAIDIMSMYSRISGATPLWTILGTAVGDLRDGAERREHGRGVRRAADRDEAIASVTTASVPSEPTMSWVRS